MVKNRGGIMSKICNKKSSPVSTCYLLDRLDELTSSQLALEVSGATQRG